MKRYGVVAFAVLLMVLGACVPVTTPPAAAPESGDAESATESIEEEATPPSVEEPPVTESTFFADEHVWEVEGQPYLLADGEYCSSLVDVDLSHAYHVIDSDEFWIYYVNFREAPSAMTTETSSPDLAACFALFWRDDDLERYLPFTTYMLTPCFVEGDVAINEYGPLTSTGMDQGSGWTPRTVDARVATFDRQGYIHCDFDLLALMQQYQVLQGSGEILIMAEPGGELTDSVVITQMVEAIPQERTLKEYANFALMAATAAISASPDEAISEPLTFGGDDLLEQPVVSHPVIFIQPGCSGGPGYTSAYEIAEAELTDMQNPAEWEPGDCGTPAQLDYVTMPDINGSGATDITLGTYLEGLEYMPDFWARGTDGCEQPSPCYIDASILPEPGHYAWVQYADLFKEANREPCLTANEGDPNWPRVDADDNPYRRLLNLRFKPIGAQEWNNWCTPSLTPSVSAHLQNSIRFFVGPNDVYIGFNPATEQLFNGSLYEIWIDPDTMTGT